MPLQPAKGRLTMKIRLGAIVAALAASTLCAAAFAADPYPAKPVRALVPYPAGGIVDIMGRLIAERVSASWGQQVIVESRPGANGMIATEALLAAPADGYTLSLIHI